MKQKFPQQDNCIIRGMSHEHGTPIHAVLWCDNQHVITTMEPGGPDLRKGWLDMTGPDNQGNRIVRIPCDDVLRFLTDDEALVIIESETVDRELMDYAGISGSKRGGGCREVCVDGCHHLPDCVVDKGVVREADNA